MGRSHGQEAEAAGMTVVAVCDVDASREAVAKEDFPAALFTTDMDAVLAMPEVDLVVLILPHFLHACVSVKASQAGKHVISEKPMCRSVAEADAMVEAGRASGKMVSVYHNRRWDGDFNDIRDLLLAGEIGEPFKIESFMGGLHAPGDWWRSDKEKSGGALFDWGAHIVDWFLHLISGEVVGVDGAFHKRRWHNVTNEDHTEATLRFAGGETATVEISSLAAAGKDRWRILGTHGAITMPGWDRIHVVFDHRGKSARYDFKPRESQGHLYYDDVYRHLTTGAPLEVTGESARRIIAMIEAAETSSREMRTVAPAYR